MMSVSDFRRFDRHPGKPGPDHSTRQVVRSTESPYAFAYARTAFKYGLLAVGLQRGDELLVPAFICESLMHPLQELGIETSYYAVDSSLRPIWSDVEANVSERSRGLVLVHYFGQPNDLAPGNAFCKSHRLLLIEDNAHGFGATWNGRLLGTFGAMGITAPRKSFPVRNGAYLHLGNEWQMDLPELAPQPDPRNRLRAWLASHARQSPRWLASRRELRRRRGPAPPYHSQYAYRDPPLAEDYGMDSNAAAMLETQDLASIRQQRQAIFEVWSEWAETRGLEPVFECADPGSMPLVFPALVSDPSEARQWFQKGHAAGIDIHSWPTLPLDIVAEDAAAMRLWGRLVCFPIHQYMDPNALATRLKQL
ncbi:DegT/DnrJ/EryC1/StrS family aminotransferase [Thioalkalivibrio sp. XN8]|uniref:DegT/DnrJ/EryC1/StrS family aminotransferase n=1 Tax=Thioalkalivibrio sp. XN8 TaxID=2712863 RepID=UPI0013E9A5EB|nr:DegT/DnrJ/EryC1/StrS family aminotransferase [Thioalkalivibrio sp. XN8]NGP53694.1 hypothetical protein [Thioalkalivibrio sp. XN8]